MDMSEAVTKEYRGPGIDEKDLEYIGHGPINRNVTFAVQRKGKDAYLLTDLGRDKEGRIVPKTVTQIPNDKLLSLSKEDLALCAYNISMSMRR